MQLHSAVCKRSLIVAVICAVLVPSTAVASRKTAIYVTDAVAISPQCLEVTTRELQFACHRVTRGDGIVVAEHRYRRSWNVDGSTYRKLSVRLPTAVAAGDVFLIEDRQVGVFFSEGSAAFAGKRGCYGTAESGSVRVLSMREGTISVEVNAIVPKKSPLDWRGDCDKPAQISQTIRAKQRSLGKLGAWEGNPVDEDSPFDEANLPD